jgi:hypothetical protein
MISKSHSEKSFSTQAKKRVGKFSPKKTISGFTIPLHLSQVGTDSENIWSVRKPTEVLSYNICNQRESKSISASTSDSYSKNSRF